MGEKESNEGPATTEGGRNGRGGDRKKEKRVEEGEEIYWTNVKLLPTLLGSGVGGVEEGGGGGYILCIDGLFLASQSCQIL